MVAMPMRYGGMEESNGRSRAALDVVAWARNILNVDDEMNDGCICCTVRDDLIG